MDVDQVEGENKDSDNTLETTALFVTQYIQSTSTSLRKDLYKLLPFFCQFVGKNFGSFTGCLICIWTMGVASKWVKPRLQNFLYFLSILIANFSENLVAIASIFSLYMALMCHSIGGHK